MQVENSVRSTLSKRWRTAVFFLLGFQLLVLNTLQSIRFNRFTGTQDEATVFQALYQISHGNLNPFSQTMGFPWIQNHGAFFMWLVAPLDRLGPPGLILLWLQGVAVVATAYITFMWVTQILELKSLENGLSERRKNALLAVSLFIITVAPWSYWSVGNDIHVEIFAAPFILLATYEFSRGFMARGLCLSGILLGFGDVSSTWLIGIAMSVVIVAVFDSAKRKQYTFLAIGLSILGLGWAGILSTFEFSKGSTFTENFGYLTVPVGHRLPNHIGFSRLIRASTQHPIRFIRAVSHHWVNIYANLAPYGLLGIATTWTLGVPLVILIENNLTPSYVFNEPSFQSFPIYGFIVVGSIILLSNVTLKFQSPKLFALVVSVVVVNVTVWSLIFLPNWSSSWISTTPAQATQLNMVLKEIPANAPVVVSENVAGRFANRIQLYILRPSLHIRNVRRPIWIVCALNYSKISSSLGTQTLPAALLESSDATLISRRNGVYLFRWQPKNVPSDFTLASSPWRVPIWNITGAAGVAVTDDVPRTWFVRSNGKSGDVLSGNFLSAAKGNYYVTLTLRNEKSLRIKIVNADTRSVIASHLLAPNSVTHNVKFNLNVPSGSQKLHGMFHGLSPFVDQPRRTLLRTPLQLVVSNATGASVVLYHVFMSKTPD